MKNGMFSASLTKVDGKLIHTKSHNQLRYKEFVRLIDEGLDVDVFMEINSADGTLAQLAKVHKCIRELANQIGETFEDMKVYVKDRAGLVVKRTVLGKEYMDWKSFGKCSREDLNLAIQACINIGDEVTLNLR